MMALMGFALLFPGCMSPKGEPRGRPVVELQDAWVPRPVALRIYPSTRFVEDEGVPMLEACIELFDALGDSTKGSGLARFELYHGPSTGDPTTKGGPAAVLYRWDIALTRLADQQAYYDPVIRGYAFPLRIDSLDVADRPVYLRVSFGLATGEHLTDEQQVKTRWE